MSSKRWLIVVKMWWLNEFSSWTISVNKIVEIKLINLNHRSNIPRPLSTKTAQTNRNTTIAHFISSIRHHFNWTIDSNVLFLNRTEFVCIYADLCVLCDCFFEVLRSIFAKCQKMNFQRGQMVTLWGQGHGIYDEYNGKPYKVIAVTRNIFCDSFLFHVFICCF